jgi:small subunit ribosomal protein S6
VNKYEAMIIVKPDLPEEEKKTLFNQISEAITKNKGTVSQTSVFLEKRKLYFPIKKQHDGMYYLVNFSVSPLAVKDISHAYSLNENILRTLFTKIEST